MNVTAVTGLTYNALIKYHIDTGISDFGKPYQYNVLVVATKQKDEWI